MKLTNVNTYRVEKEYQQYYKGVVNLQHLTKSKSLRDTYTQAWIKLLTSKIN